MFRCDSDGTFRAFEETDALMVDDWGVREIINLDGSMDANWSITVDGETLTYDGEFTPPVSEWIRPDYLVYARMHTSEGQSTHYLVDNLGRAIVSNDHGGLPVVFSAFYSDGHYAPEEDHLTGTTPAEFFSDWGIHEVVSEVSDLNVYTFQLGGQPIVIDPLNGTVEPAVLNYE